MDTLATRCNLFPGALLGPWLAKVRYDMTVTQIKQIANKRHMAPCKGRCVKFILWVGSNIVCFLASDLCVLGGEEGKLVQK